VDSTHRLPVPDVIEDGAVSDDISDNVEQSSVTESDDDIAVVEADDPFFKDPLNNHKISKKLEAEVRLSNPNPPPIIDSNILILASYMVG
jgi:hypothetical protein